MNPWFSNFFSSFFARKDSYTKCKKIATRILLSQFVFAFCILISSRLPQWVEIFSEGALFFRLRPEELRSIFFSWVQFSKIKSNKNKSQKFTDSFNDAIKVWKIIWFFVNIHEHRITNDPSEVVSTNHCQCLAATFFDLTQKKDDFFFFYT